MMTTRMRTKIIIILWYMMENVIILRHKSWWELCWDYDENYEEKYNMNKNKNTNLSYDETYYAIHYYNYDES